MIPGRHPEPPRKSPLHQSAYKPDPRDQELKNPPHTTRPKTDQRRLSEYHAHRESAPRRHANLQREQGGNGSTPRSPYRASAGPASPMQQNNQARPKHRSTGMQTPERRVSSEGHGQHTPGRIRNPSGQGYEVIIPYFLLRILNESRIANVLLFLLLSISLKRKLLYHPLVIGMMEMQHQVKSTPVSSIKLGIISCHLPLLLGNHLQPTAKRTMCNRYAKACWKYLYLCFIISHCRPPMD
jgi:hypothetical protein